MPMRLMLAVSAVAILAVPNLALAGQANAPTVQAPALSPAAQADQADANKIVCKSVLVTGSRFPERQCATKYAWAKQEEEARKAGHEVIDRAVVNTSHGD